MEADFTNVELYQLVFDRRINEVLESKDAIGSPDVNELMLNTLLPIEVYQVPVSKLQGTPLKALCELVVYAKRGGFAADSAVPKQYAIAYLDSVSNEVAEEMAKSHPHHSQFANSKTLNGQLTLDMCQS